MKAKIIILAFIIVGPQALPTLLKAIAVMKSAYLKLMVHSPKRPWRTQGELMDSHQFFDLPTISPPVTPLEFELVTSTLISLVGPQTLSTLLKTIVVRKGVYPNLIVHSPKCPQQTQGELMDAINPSICQQLSSIKYYLNVSVLL